MKNLCNFVFISIVIVVFYVLGAMNANFGLTGSWGNFGQKNELFLNPSENSTLENRMLIESIFLNERKISPECESYRKEELVLEGIVENKLSGPTYSAILKDMRRLLEVYQNRVEKCDEGVFMTNSLQIKSRDLASGIYGFENSIASEAERQDSENYELEKN